MKKKTLKLLLWISIIWLLLIPIGIVLHNVFSALFGEASVLSVIFFLIGVFLGMGFIIPIILIIIAIILNKINLLININVLLILYHICYTIDKKFLYIYLIIFYYIDCINDSSSLFNSRLFL